MNCSIGDIRKSLASQKKKQKTSGGGSSEGAGIRYVLWKNPKYSCIRTGNRVFVSEAEIHDAFRNKSLHEGMFFIYKNKCAGVERNKTVPLYEAVYAVGSYFVKVQQKHLAQGYRNAGKRDGVHAWDVDEKGVPYWVDRHAFSEMK